MKNLLYISAKTSKLALLTALLAIPPGSAAAATTMAHWTFSQTQGPVVNEEAAIERDVKLRHSGWAGYSIDNGDDGEVNRDGERVTFNGQRDSIILIDDANHTDFNPGPESLIITMQFAVDQSALNNEALAPKETWNLIQKGRFNNSGGQWKMQIRKAPAGRLFLQCLINDDKPDTRREAAQIALQKPWVKESHTLLGRCVLNRPANELILELTNLTIGSSKSKVTTTTLSTDFGNVDPQAGDCGTPNAFGGNVSIGNKPLCPDQELDTDDAFRGVVFSAQIERSK